jgi:hypothetical protein
MSHAEPHGSSATAKEAVLISGMHRSGTSAASRALSFLGYSQPQVLTEAGPANPKGFWESTRIVQLNEEMISSLGWSWDHTPLLTQPAGSPSEAEAEILAHLSAVWLERAREAIRTSYREDAVRVVCKDPRLSLFPAFWEAAFAAEGFTVQHLLAFRQPLKVIDSLQRHRGMGRAAALRAWLTYNLRPLTQVEVAATIDYGDLLRAPKKAVNAAADVLHASALDKAAAAELREFIDPAKAEAETEAADEAEMERLPEMVRATYALLRAWRAGPNERLGRQADRLRQSLADAQMLFGRVRRLPPLVTTPAIYRLSAPAVAAEQAQRAVVLHYHLFKNAGTSVDVVLEGNFGSEWREAEFDIDRTRPNVGEVEAWLAANPTVKALSSHTARGPLPRLANVAIAPVILVRHPIDRIRSAYEFERRQKPEGPGPRLARDNDFAGYIEARLRRRDRQCRNFQTWRLATFGRQDAPELEQALIALDSLPFVGLVEDFAGSMTRMEAYLREVFPSFRAFGAKANVWREGRTLEERLDDARAELGAELWADLIEANHDDLEVFATVAARYDLPLDAVMPD